MVRDSLRIRADLHHLIGVASAAVLLAGCSDPAPPPPPPPAEVNVVTVTTSPVPNVIEVPGRLQAIRIAEVRARVDGIVEKRVYTEGTDVRAGQSLFEIDPRPVQAQVNSARATLARARANATNASQEVARYEGLVADEAISKLEYDAAVARARIAEADVAQAEAQLEAALLALSYTRVMAPIAGRAGRAEVTEGALVSAGAGTLLTRIEQLDPIYANFSQSSSEMLAMQRDLASGTLAAPTGGRVTARLVLEDGSEYPLAGQLDFRGQSIDPATGSTALRATFPNPDRALLPGQFVRVRLETGTRTAGILVPQRAVMIAPTGASVYVVGAGDTVAVRPVGTGQLQGDQWIITEGLSAGDRVITDGLQKVRPGAVVRVAP